MTVGNGQLEVGVYKIFQLPVMALFRGRRLIGNAVIRYSVASYTIVKALIAFD